MKIDLNFVCDQLTEAIGIKDDRKVAALFDDDKQFIGWSIVRYNTESGEIIPMLGTRCNTLKEFFEKFYENID